MRLDDRGSSEHGEARDGAGLRDYLRVARRRKWIILQAVVLVPAAAVLLSLGQVPLYEASAEVLLSRQNLATSLTGTPDPTASLQAERVAQTQAELAHVPTVAARTLTAAKVSGRTPEQLLERSEVSAKQNADLLEFRVTDSSPALAVLLANEYARQYTNYRRELDTTGIKRAAGEVRARIGELDALGQGDTPLYASLLEKEQQLSTMEALQTSNAFVVRSAATAEQVQPRPVRNGLLALALGLLVGVGLAFLWDAFDTRVRSADEIAQRLHLALLARIPEPPRKLRKENRLIMAADPMGAQAEPFRMLRTNLEFANLEREAQVIMVTSAVESEGKSTTVSNLALALARAGKRVVLVDLDLRRPVLHQLFGLEGHSGLTQVALGHVTVDRALARVTLGSEPTTGPSAHLSGRGDGKGGLTVLTSGPLPPDAGEFVATRALASVLHELRSRADVVLIDAPPLLQLGDAMTLSGKVDALLVVTRLKVVRRPLLNELRRVLAAIPTPKLGFVVTGAETEEGYGSGYGGYYHRAYAGDQKAAA